MLPILLLFIISCCITHQFSPLVTCELINFKILLITVKALQGQAPNYIIDFQVPYVPQCSLRSSGKSLLVVPSTSF